VFNLLVGLLFSLSALAQPAFLKEGLVAYYPFNGNAIDESGNGNNGLIRNAILTKDRHSVQNSAMSFDGSSAFIEIPSTKSLESLGRITVSCWINADNLFPQSGQQGWKSSCIAAKGLRSGEATDWALAIDGNRIRPHIFVNGWNYYDSPGVILKQKWHHVVFSYDGSSTRTYADGIIINEAFRNVGILPSSNLPLYIGAYLPSSLSNKNYFPGLIDEFRIYNRALTDNEVKALYDYESTPPDNSFITNGLVAYYPLNGSMNDESISKLNASKSGPSQFETDRFGQFNSALRLLRTGENESGSIDLPNNAETKKQTATYSIWFRPDENVVESSISDYFLVILNSGPDYHPLFYRTIDSQSPILRVYPYRLDKTSDVILTPGAWTQLSLVVDGNKAYIYQDGFLKYTTAQYYDNAQHPVVSIGNLRGYGYHSARGTFDDIRIYNRALSGTEVRALYNYESTPAIQSPVFLVQPQSQSVTAGNDAIFCVTLKDAGTYNYQWQFNEQNIAGATLSCYTVNSVTAAMNGGRYRVIVSNSAGTVISDSATLTVVTPPPPAISSQPIGRTVQEGSNVSFAVVATGQGSLVYQWQLNEQNLPGATSATLNLNGVKQNQSGRYRVLVSSPYGVTISDTVTLAVNPNPPPTIVTQPLSRTPAEGTQVSLTVTATGLGSLTYQWQINNQNIPGATSSTLVLSAARPSANGKYRVIVGNPYGTTISTEATVTVVVTDADSDGLSDYEELLVGTNANKADTDGDGLSDFAEVRTHGSNPLTTDTDGDGYSDGIEVARDGNPSNRSVTPTGALAVFPAVDVEFYTLNSVKYQLEVSTDMVSWSAQGGVVVGNGGSQNHLVRASKTTQFWRLKVVQ
jgi:hypothetical protein